MPRKNPLLRISLAGALLLGGLLTAAPRPAEAQATITVNAGLGQSYRSEGWVPVRVTLTNQGAPARVEVRARILTMGQGVQEYRIPPRDLPSGANELHTLYMKSPRTYGSQPITVDFYRDGRVINTVRPQLRPVPEDAWLIYGIGPEQNTAPLNLLSTTNMPPRLPRFPGAPPNQRNTPATVAVSETAEAPDRWQGLEGADVVVLAGTSERDFRPEQLAAIRDYAVAGGTVVVTGGLNWNRLDTPFFRELLPVRVTGSATATSLGSSTFASPPGGAFPVCTAEPKPGAQVLLGTEQRPMVVSGQKGSGRVLFFAFDPALPPFRDWSETRNVWAAFLKQQVPGTLIGAVTRNEASYEDYGGMPPGYYGGGSQGRLADAPFAIPQLDIPAFYVVALFLLSYVVILVPVNYFFLKARDKKEYAWITTPVIVALFSVGAYLIGYAFKGGNTLAVKVGLVEAHADQTSAPFLFYSGLFSPRKTGYDVQFAAANPQQDAFSNALFSEPENSRSRAGLQLSMEDQPRVDDFAVDMWAMRVLKSEGVAPLGQGVQSRVQLRGNRIEGSIRNGTPFHLDGCAVVVGTQVLPVGSLPPGGTTNLSQSGLTGGPQGTLLPPSLQEGIRGDSQQARMRRAILGALSGGMYQTPSAAPSSTMGLRLVGWIREPVGKLQVDGKAPREVAETLLVVHL